jgi:hypothetical protein
MTALHTFEIPEDDVRLANWLESMIAGPHLGDFVSELEVLRQAGAGKGLPPQTTLDEILGNRLDAVCAKGLAAVPPTSLRRLFRQPQLLIDLQERVLSEGSAYWDRKLGESTELSRATEVGWQRLLDLPIWGPSVVSRPDRQPQTRPVRWFAAGFAAAAAAAFMVVFIGEHLPGPSPVATTGWGWNRPDAFPQDVTRAQYFRALADAGAEWRNKRPDTPQSLAKRINEFREGCSQLILAEHRSLTPADRKWLKEHCQTWSKALDEQLTALESGKPVTSVRDQVDGIADRLTKALADRAAEPIST